MLGDVYLGRKSTHCNSQQGVIDGSDYCTPISPGQEQWCNGTNWSPVPLQV